MPEGYTAAMALRQPLPTPPHEPQPLTVDDWFAMPDDGRQYELFEGVLILVTPPGRRHQDILRRLIVTFDRLTAAHGGYVGFAPMGVALAARFGLEPDLVYVAPGREDVLTDRGVEGIPDLVVEVLSPSTQAFDRGTKLRTYLELGVPEVWIVDPEARTVSVHHPGGEAATVAFGERIPSTVIDAGAAGLA